MSQWDPNDPNNPYNQQQQGQQGQQWGQQQGQQGQPQQGQQQHGQQQWGQQQGQPQQQLDPSHRQQQQQPQQQWDPSQGQQQQQGYGGGQQQQQWGQQPAMQGAAHGQAAYGQAYSETFGDTSKSMPGAVATLGVNERVQFLRKTYAHLFGAIAAFAVLEFLFLWQKSPLYDLVTIPFVKTVFGGSRFIWLAVLGVFVAVGWFAEKWAKSDTSIQKQYMGLGIYVLAESVIFIPLLFIAQYYSAKAGAKINIIAVSGIITMALFAGLTATVFISKKDFSFMRGALSMGTMAAMGIIVAAIIFGFDLGLFFSGAMILLAGGYVLYYTSQVLHYYRPGQHVAASLALFSAVALMFWYVVRVVMELAGR